ncbi:MAG: methyltransferase domain-containing protein [Candidatus Staskawiczbacteria bacterium]|jgi:2-polyprenyl-3-methyl-5-hydroxy-6-metoxy-1,4-benzoquinol methylase
MSNNKGEKQTGIDQVKLGEIFYTHKKRSPYSYEAYYSFFKTYILQHLPTDKKIRILDVGCGNGHLLYSLQKKGYANCFGIDSCKKQIDNARKKMDCVELVDVFQYLSCHEKEFDVIILIDVAEHFGQDDLFRLLKTINNSLRQGGILIMHTINGFSPFLQPYYYGDPTHQQIYSSKIIGGYALLAGFKEYREFPSTPEYFPCLESINLRSFIRLLLKIGQWFLWHLISRIYGLIEYVAVGKYKRFYTPNFIIVCEKS